MSSFDDLTLEEKKLVKEAFSRLAKAQRGEPEYIATQAHGNPLFRATGLFTYLAEHIGDLTHRLTEGGGDWIDFGFEAVSEKVEKGLRCCNSMATLEEQIRDNLKNNYVYRKKNAPQNVPGNFKDYTRGFKESALEYARLHSKLDVMNEAQWHAREAAVDLGKMDFMNMEAHLEVLSQHLQEGKKSWRTWAGAINIIDGNVLLYDSSNKIEDQPVFRSL
jgi:hypothetical protein